MKMHPAEILEKISALSGTGSLKAKSAIVKEHLDVPEFVKTVQYALDPWKNFYTTTVPGLSEVTAKSKKRSDERKKGYRDIFDTAPSPLPWKEQFSTMFALLDDMSTRKLPPNSDSSRKAILDWADRVGPGTISVFRRILLKDLRCGMGAASFNKIQKGWVPEFKIQLAQPFDESRLKFPCYVDPKFDGERCLAFISYDGQDGDVTYFSRNGNQFPNYGCFTPHLLKLFSGCGCTVADCEVISKMGFQNLMSTPSKYSSNFDTNHLQLMVFDWMPQSAFEKGEFDLSQTKRLSELTKLFSSFVSDKVLMVDSRLVKDWNEATSVYDYWVSQGLEGVILKQPDGLYEFKRSDAWTKMKPKKTEDLRVVGMELGNKNRQWADKCGSLVVERTSSNGSSVRVNVASGLTEYDHENISQVGDQILWKSPDGQLIDIKGQMVEVVFDCETNDGSLRFPRIKRRPNTLIRTDK